MKKLLFIFSLVIVLVISLSSCKDNSKFIKQENINFNYNNITADNSSFWLEEDKIYYLESFLFSNSVYSLSENGRKLIAAGKAPDYTVVQAYDDELLIVDSDSEKYYLESKSIVTGKKKYLCSFEDIPQFFMIDKNVFFSEGFNGFERPLKMLSLENNTTVEIAKSSIAAGVIDGKATYIVKDDDRLKIYSYVVENAESKLIGEFKCQIPENSYIEFNFTSGYVLLDFSYTLDVEENAYISKIMCYDLKNEELKEFNINGYIWSLIAYDEYAFAVIQDWETKDYALYRIRLEDGNIEKIADVDNWIDTFVTSDDCVYVYSSSADGLNKYNASREKTFVCRF